MSYKPARGGSAKGAGSGNAKAPSFTPETARTLGQPARSKNQMLIARAQELMAADDSLRFLKAKTLAWRELYPEEAAEKAREREIKAMIAAGTEDALEALYEVITDSDHKDRVTAAKAWVEHDIGKARQAVELAGKDGAALVVQVVKFTEDDPTPT